MYAGTTCLGHRGYRLASQSLSLLSRSSSFSVRRGAQHLYFTGFISPAARARELYISNDLVRPLGVEQMDALKNLMASPKRLLEAVGEYVADRVVGPVPTSMQSLAADSPRFLTHPPAAPPVAAPAVAIKRQSIAAPDSCRVKIPRVSLGSNLGNDSSKKASPGSKKKVSPLKTVKPEPMSKTRST